MRGGAGRGKFYITEVDRIELEHQSASSKPEWSAKEIEAGYKDLGTKYGFFGTLLAVEASTGIKRNELMKWPIIEFNFQLRYMTDKGIVDRKYQELQNKELK